MKKILITGGKGFIGSNVLPFLRMKGYNIYATCLEKEENSHSDISWITVDLLDLKAISEIFKIVKPEYLLHFAWYVDPKDYLKSSLNLNWVSSSIFLYQEFIKNGGRRAVFAGTSAEYDFSNQELKEDSSCTPSTIYGTCKYSLFKILEKYSEINKLSFAWGRIFNLYGPGEHPDRFIPYLINSLLDRKKVICKNPYLSRDYLHVEDIARAFVELLESNYTGPVNIGSGNSYLLKNIVNRLVEILDGKSLVEFLDSQDQSKLVPDVSVLKKIIKFSPSYELENGLVHTIAWWKNKHLSNSMRK